MFCCMRLLPTVRPLRRCFCSSEHSFKELRGGSIAKRIFDRVRADALAARAERTYAEIEDPNVEKVRAWRRTHHLPPRR